MKKLLLTGAIALFAAVNAQETKFGAKAGYAMSSLTLESDGQTETTDAKHTFYVGGLVEHKFNDNIGLQGELLYSPLGGQENLDEEFSGYYVKGSSKINLGTLMIPVSVKYYPVENLAIGAGLNFGIIMSAKADYESNLPAELVDFVNGETDIKDEINSLNLAPFIGAEYNLENGLFFDARYNLGVSNLAKDATDGSSVKNSFLMVGIGYKFGN